MDRRERRLLIFSCAAHVVSDGWAYLFPSLLFLIALDFRENFFVLGILANVLIASTGISGVLAGFLADLLSTRRMFVAFALISSLGCVLVVLAWDEISLGVALFVLGIGVGLYHPVGLSAITRNIKRRSTALGMHGLAGGVGSSVLPVVLVSLGVAFGWRVSFAAAAVAALALLPAMRLVSRDFERPPGAGMGAVASLRRMVGAMDDRRLLAVYSSSIIRSFGYTGFLTFLTTAIALETGLEDTRVLGVSATGFFASLALGSGGIGSLIGGRLGERFNQERLLTILIAAPAPILLVLGITGGPLLLALAPLAALVFSTGDPILGSLIGRYLPADMHGKGFAVLFGVGQAIGSPVGVLAGWVTHNYGVQWVFPVMAISPLAALPILVLFLWPRQPVSGEASTTARIGGP